MENAQVDIEQKHLKLEGWMLKTNKRGKSIREKMLFIKETS